MAFNPKDYYNEETGVYEVRNVVIHGGIYRALQFGYGGYASETGVPDEYNPSPVVALQNLNYIVPGADTASPHSHGIPAFTMWIRVEDFVRTVDRKVGCTITKACLQQFPMWSMSSNTSERVKPTEVKEGQPDVTSIYKLNAVPTNYRIGTHPYDALGYNGTRPFVTLFGHPYTISAALYSGDRQIASATLFTADSDKGYWKGPSDYSPGTGLPSNADPNVGITTPIELRGTVTNMNDPVTFVILNYSACSCDQTNKYRPVFSTDITEFIPPVDPYIWRKFGNNATEDPVGATINTDKLDGKWHLVRPLYRMDGSSLTWQNVEDEIDG